MEYNSNDKQLNITMASENSFLPDDKLCVSSLSNPTFKSNAIICRYLADDPDVAPMLSLLHQEIGYRYNCHDIVSRLISAQRALVENKRTSPFSQRGSGRRTTNFQYNVLLKRSENRDHDAKTAGDNIRHSSDDKGFYSATDENNLVVALDTNNFVKNLPGTQGKQWEDSAPGFLNNEVHRDQSDRCDLTAIETIETRSLKNHPSKALLGISPTPPAPTVTCVSTLGTTISLQNDLKDIHHWYVILPKSWIKEKLTRRQLFQIAAMTALGFIFVALIIIWVFSPILF